MRISYDPEADALSIVFLDTTVTTQELAEGIIGEYDQDGCLAGIEILNAAIHTGGIDTYQRVVLEPGRPAVVS